MNRTLNAEIFDVDRNGSSISIAVAAEEKTRLLSILINAGISVMDFDIERSN